MPISRDEGIAKIEFSEYMKGQAVNTKYNTTTEKEIQIMTYQNRGSKLNMCKQLLKHSNDSDLITSS